MATEPLSAPEKLERSTIKSSKGEVLQLEKDNFRHLILWHSNQKWWKMCGHSALIYAHFVAPNLLGKENVQIHIDTDRYHFSADGTVSISNLEKLAADLAQHDIKQAKSKNTEIVIFNLPTKFAFDQRKIDDLRTIEAGNRAKVNDLLYAKIDDQYLESLIRKTAHAIFNRTNSLKKERFDTIAVAMREGAITLFSIKNQLSRGEIDITEAYRNLRHESGQLMCLLDLAYELNYYNTTSITSLAKHLHDIYITVNKALQTLEKESK